MSKLVEAVLALDAAGAEYTVRLPAAEASAVWRQIAQPQPSPSLIEQVNRDLPVLKLRAGESRLARVDFAISRDSIGKIWLQIGMFCAGAEADELGAWRERTLQLLAEFGAQTISAGYDESDTYLAITGGTWP